MQCCCYVSASVFPNEGFNLSTEACILDSALQGSASKAEHYMNRPPPQHLQLEGGGGKSTIVCPSQLCSKVPYLQGLCHPEPSSGFRGFLMLAGKGLSSWVKVPHSNWTSKTEYNSFKLGLLLLPGEMVHGSHLSLRSNIHSPFLETVPSRSMISLLVSPSHFSPPKKPSL